MTEEIKSKGQVNISQTQLDSILQQNKDLTKRLDVLETRNKPKIARKVKESFARMRVYKGKYVVEDLKSLREKVLTNDLDEKEKVLVCDVVVSDGKSEPETISAVRYNEFLETCEIVPVEILSIDKKEEAKYANKAKPTILVKEYSEKGDSIGMKTVGEIENVIVVPVTKITVKLPNGETIKLSNNALNI